MTLAYLDSCVVIYYIEKEPTLAPRIGAALRALGGQGRAVASDLTRMECRVGPRSKDDNDLLARYDAFFALGNVEFAALDAAAFDLATDLRATHGLKTPDALHLAAAIRHGCDEFWTRDRRLASAAMTRGVQVITFEAAP